MKVHTLKSKQKINKSLKEVFDFFKSPENLSKLTPSKLNFKILTPTPIEMKNGQLIDYTIKILGFKVHWRTVITSYLEPYEFVDQQLVGPYKMWHHEHIFKIKENGVLMKDIVTYIPPFGLIGKIANYLFIKRRVNQIFDYRNKIITQIFNNSKD